METHNIFGYTRGLQAESNSERGIIRYLSMHNCGNSQCTIPVQVILLLLSDIWSVIICYDSLPTLLQSTQPSTPPLLPLSDGQNPDQCDQRVPESDLQTASLEVRWSLTATAASSLPHWWSCKWTGSCHFYRKTAMRTRETHMSSHTLLLLSK